MKKENMVKNGTFSQPDDPFGDDGLDASPPAVTIDTARSEMAGPSSRNTDGLTIEDVKRAIVGSVGDVTTIAANLGIDRVAMRRYIKAHPEAQEAIEDEILSARENVMKQTYMDAVNGVQPARADFFRMTGGMFDKHDDKGAETQQLIIQFSKKPTTFKALDPVTGETSDVKAEDLMPVVDADYSDGEADDEDDEEGEVSGETAELSDADDI